MGFNNTASATKAQIAALAAARLAHESELAKWFESSLILFQATNADKLLAGESVVWRFDSVKPGENVSLADATLVARLATNDDYTFTLARGLKAASAIKRVGQNTFSEFGLTVKMTESTRAAFASIAASEEAPVKVKKQRASKKSATPATPQSANDARHNARESVTATV